MYAMHTYIPQLPRQQNSVLMDYCAQKQIPTKVLKI